MFYEIKQRSIIMKRYKFKATQIRRATMIRGGTT